MKFIVLVIFLIVAFRSWAGLDEGIYAYQRGDFSAALREFQPLAERGVAKAQFGLCLIYSRSQDYTHAADWCRRAAERGVSVAQSFLGEMGPDRRPRRRARDGKSDARLDVLIQSEEVFRVIPALQRHQAIIVLPIRGTRSFRTLVAEKIHIGARG